MPSSDSGEKPLFTLLGGSSREMGGSEPGTTGSNFSGA